MINVLSYPVDMERLLQFSRNTFPPSFRYFKSHPVEESFGNHIYTALYTVNGADAGYVHLDRDTLSGRVFLGICVLPTFQKRGIGNNLLNSALRCADSLGIKVYLTVDTVNIVARNMYVKYGFLESDKQCSHMLFMRNPGLPYP